MSLCIGVCVHDFLCISLRAPSDLFLYKYQKLLQIEKEIVCEVIRGDKHNMRKSANRNAQISVIHSAH